jgi:hypothetical protein
MQGFNEKEQRHFLLFTLYVMLTERHPVVKSMRTHSDEWQPLFYLIYVTRKKKKNDRLTSEEKKKFEGLLRISL